MNRDYKIAKVFYNKIKEIPNLKHFLPEIERFSRYTQNPNCVIGWGNKNTSKKAIKYSKNIGVDYISVEDGFIRSIGLGINNSPPLSLIIDNEAVFYNPNSNHGIKKILNEYNFTENDINRAEKVKNFILENKITKYNTGFKNLPNSIKTEQNYILLFDQTFNDASVLWGSDGKKSFEEMFAFATETFPDKKIVIKTHPDVIAGKKKGYLSDKFNEKNVLILSDDVNPYSLFENAYAVMVVTSLTGFEALLSGKDVYCFGKPFYYGYGLTKLENKPLENYQLLKLLFASYIKYPRYLDIFNKKPCEIEDVLEIIATHLQQVEKQSKFYHCLGFSNWKKPHILPFLKNNYNQVKFYTNLEKAENFKKNLGGDILVWGAKEDLFFSHTSNQKNYKIIEDGFIRSFGLGSQLIPASSLVIDNSGIYYNAQKPSDLENFLNTHQFNDQQRNQAKNYIELILQNNLTKYNLAIKNQKIEINKNQKIILVVGQVEDDASIKKGLCQITSNLQLLKTTKDENPDAFIIYKPHPDVLANNRKGKIDDTEVEKYADINAKNHSITYLMDISDITYTITSFVGFEMLLRRKQVKCFGVPFYSNWGLTEDVIKIERRNRKLSLEELFYASIVMYPLYFDLESKLFMSFERYLNRFIQNPDLIKNAENNFGKNKLIRFLKWR
jgi:capsular polysaccharide export protein